MYLLLCAVCLLQELQGVVGEARISLEGIGDLNLSVFDDVGRSHVCKVKFSMNELILVDVSSTSK